MSLNKKYGHELVLIHKNFSYVDNAFIIENDSTGDLHKYYIYHTYAPTKFGDWYTTVCWKYLVSINLSNCTSNGKHDLVYL